MKIGIIGGGNMGCVLATKFSQNHDVTLYSNLPDKINLYRKDMQVITEDTNKTYQARINKITGNIKELCESSDYIFVTFPAFLFEPLFKEMEPYLRHGHHLFFVPGSGGAELFFKKALDKGVTISGLQRVHSVARIIDFGKLTKESGIRKELKLASIPNSYNEEACKVVSELYSLPVVPLDNYLNVTFVNSNPILHTSRLYSIFKDYKKTVNSYESLPLFYEEWSDDTSKLLVEMDKELFSMIHYLSKYGFIINQITSLLTHYESTSYQGLTNKLKSINSLKGLTTPSVKTDNDKYIPDLNSRYFTADYPYGLDILIGFSKLLNIECPNMIKVSDWYHAISNTKRIFALEKYGIKNIDQLVKFYK